MRCYPTRIHGHRDERFGVSGGDPCRSDRADSADGDLIVRGKAYRADLFEPLDLDTVR